ncbi:MAG: serine/threonine protein kinase [Nocardioides sp.]|uniref:serine/threonine-protein kinase n=1 Tax=Nocardioides kribbensis TaxID=305517 RepID=UPI001A205DD2|nr:serine/threonine protein kinase [Nocardioides sp.]
MIAGRYTLDREVGRGGMGAVWLGRDEVLGRQVAVKRIGLAPGASDADLHRAEREAKLAARLNHPHVVAVFDLVDEGDQQWLVMEYVEGTNLSGLLRDRGRLTPDQAAPLLGQAADALAAAHAAGIVHRDVKPSNMLVTDEGHLKLSDFGIARAEADPSLTQTGLVTGSPAYLAPEVASGSTATDRSDVWSLGASLYHALSGHPPYEVKDNVLGALYRIVHEDPPRLDDAGWLAPLLEHTMTHDPAERWPMHRVRDFLAAGPGSAETAVLPRAGSGETQRLSVLPPVSTGVAPVVTPAAAAAATGGRAERPRRAGRVLAAALALVAIAAVTGLAFVLGNDRATEQPATAAPGSGGSASGSPEASPSGSPSGSPSPTAQPRPTAASMTAFVDQYIPLAASDPESAFAMLTPAFQQASGGLDGYLGFWGTVRRAEVLDVSADPAAGTVSYVYRRQTEAGGGPVEESVTLQLQQQSDGSYLIAGDLS